MARSARLSFNSQECRLVAAGDTGVADGTRTRNNWNHNPGLYR